MVDFGSNDNCDKTFLKSQDKWNYLFKQQKITIAAVIKSTVPFKFVSIHSKLFAYKNIKIWYFA